jgi:Protein of unknown function (DUF1524)
MQQYRTRYLLAKLTQFVDMAYKGLKTPGSLGEYTVLEIEHILPDKPSSVLLSAFVAANPNSRYDDYKNKLGNLTLLEKPINIVASNDFFKAKKDEYRKCKHYLTSSIAGIVTVGQNTTITRINDKLQAFDDWTSTSIDKRHELLMGLARDVWKAVPMPIQ